MSVKAKIGFEEVLSRFVRVLKSNGLKYTNQREVILRAIVESEGHFIPEELKAVIMRNYEGLNIGTATVYRTLALLEEAGIVTSVSFGASGKKYEFGLKEHHDHMICDSCGAMIEFVDKEIEKRQKEIAAAKGFKIVSHAMQIRGLCKACQKAKS